MISNNRKYLRYYLATNRVSVRVRDGHLFYTGAILSPSSLADGPSACADWIRVPQDSGYSTDREHALYTEEHRTPLCCFATRNRQGIFRNCRPIETAG